jgi:hypothetical protein
VSDNIYVLDSSFLPVVAIDLYGSFVWTRNYYSAGNFKLVLDYQTNVMKHLVNNNFVLAPDGQVFLIEAVDRKIDYSNSLVATVEVTGKCIKGFFSARNCLPPAGLAHDEQIGVSAETALKNIVNNNVGVNADVKRKLSSFFVAPDQQRGLNVSIQARYQPLSKVCEDIAKAGAIGYEVTYTSSGLVLDIISTEDVTGNMAFQVELDTAKTQRWLSSNSLLKNYALVAGKGDGVARIIVPVYAGTTEPENWLRRELFVDARDIDNTRAMATRGLAGLSETALADTFEVTINNDGGFKYPDNWNLGYLVTVRNKEWNLEKAARVISVTQNKTLDTPATTSTVVLDRPLPSLKDLLAKRNQSVSYN